MFLIYRFPFLPASPFVRALLREDKAIVKRRRQRVKKGFVMGRRKLRRGFTTYNRNVDINIGMAELQSIFDVMF
jgi:hypothetical protein